MDAGKIYRKIKNQIILSKIFSFLSPNREKPIIHYSIFLRKILFKIEIEVVVHDNLYGKFVNIKDKEKQKYHIFFDDNMNEIESTIIKKKDKVKKIKIISYSENKSLANLFKNCKIIKSIKFISCNRFDIENLSYLFNGCPNLKEIDLKNLITSNVTYMSHMFEDCSSLKKLI